MYWQSSSAAYIFILQLLQQQLPLLFTQMSVCKLKHSLYNPILTFKTIIIGDSGVGKTALIQKYITGSYQKQFNVTVGVDFSSKTVKVEGKTIQLQIWDTSGQDIYKSVTANFYRGAAAVFLLYSVNDRQSFKNVIDWLNQFHQKGSPQAFVFLVGTKNDLPSQVSSQQAIELLKSFEGAFFIQTCSKEGNSVQKLFEKAAQSMYKLYTVSQEYRELVDPEKRSPVQTNYSDIRTSAMSFSLDRAPSVLYDHRRKKNCC